MLQNYGLADLLTSIFVFVHDENVDIDVIIIVCCLHALFIDLTRLAYLMLWVVHLCPCMVVASYWSCY